MIQLKEEKDLEKSFSSIQFNNKEEINEKNHQKINQEEKSKDNLVVPLFKDKKSSNKLSVPQIILLANLFSFPFIIFTILIILSIIFQGDNLRCFNSKVVFYTISFIISDFLVIFSWWALFYAALKKLCKLTKICIFLLILSLILKTISVTLQANNLSCRNDKSYIGFIFGIIDIIINLIFLIADYILFNLMNKMNRKEWKRQFKKFKKKLKKNRICSKK